MSFVCRFAEVKLQNSQLVTLYCIQDTSNSSISTFATFDDLLNLEEFAAASDSDKKLEIFSDSSLFLNTTHTETIEKRRLAAQCLLLNVSKDLIQSKLFGSSSSLSTNASCKAIGNDILISPHTPTVTKDSSFLSGSLVPISFENDLEAFDDLLESGYALMDVTPSQSSTTIRNIKEGMLVSIQVTSAVWDGHQAAATGIEKFNASFVVGDWRGTIDIVPPGLHLALLKLPATSSSSKIVVSPQFGFGNRGKFQKKEKDQDSIQVIIPSGAHVLYHLVIESVSGNNHLNMSALQNGVLEQLSKDNDDLDDITVGTRGLVISATSAPVTTEMLNEATSFNRGAGAGAVAGAGAGVSSNGLRGEKLESGVFKMPTEDEAIKLFLASQSKR